MIKKMLVLLCIAILNPYTGFSQIENSDCLKHGPDRTPYKLGFGAELRPYEINASIGEFGYRIIGNKLEIVFDKSAIISNKWCLSDDAMMDYIRFAIITQGSFANKELAGGKDIVEITFPFETECVSYPGCYIKLVSEGELVCNEDPNFDYSDILHRINGEKYFRYIRKVVCGTKCCEVVYEVKLVDGYFDITKKYVRDYEGSTCQPTGIKNCKTGAEVKCESDCNIK